MSIGNGPANDPALPSSKAVKSANDKLADKQAQGRNLPGSSTSQSYLHSVQNTDPKVPVPYSNYDPGRSSIYGSGTQRSTYEDENLYGEGYAGRDYLPAAVKTVTETTERPYLNKIDWMTTQGANKRAAVDRRTASSKDTRDYDLDVNELDQFIQQIKNGMYDDQLASLGVEKQGLIDQFAIDNAGFADAHKKNRKDRTFDLWGNDDASTGASGYMGVGRKKRDKKINRLFREDKRGIIRETDSAAIDYRVGMDRINTGMDAQRDNQTIGAFMADKFGLGEDRINEIYNDVMRDAGFEKDDITSLWDGKAELVSDEMKAEVARVIEEAGMEQTKGPVGWDEALAFTGGKDLSGMNPATRDIWEGLKPQYDYDKGYITRANGRRQR